MCGAPWSALQKMEWAVTSEPQLLPSPSVPDGSDSRETYMHVSTPWSVPRDTPEKLAHMLDSSVRVSQQQRRKNQKTNVFCTSIQWMTVAAMPCSSRCRCTSRRARVCACLRLDAALQAAIDGHVTGLQGRRASWRDEAQYDVWKRRPHGAHGGLSGVDAGHVPEKDPRLSCLARVHDVVQSGRELLSYNACTICTSVSKAARSMLMATVNVVAFLVLPCS